MSEACATLRGRGRDDAGHRSGANAGAGGGRRRRARVNASCIGGPVVILQDKVVVITGAAGGIGSALARRFAAEKVGALVLADLDEDRVNELAGELGDTEVMAAGVDVTDEDQVAELVNEALRQYTRIDLFCSNAGITTGAGLEATDEQWARIWSVNVLAHIYAARAVLPSMLERGEGYLLQTCSA